MDTSRQAALRKVVLIGDAVLVCLSMLLAQAAHTGLRARFGLLKPPPPFAEYAAVAYSALPIWLLLIVYFDLHRVMEKPWGQRELLRALVGVHVMGLVGLSLVLLLTQGVINRSLIAFFLAVSFSSLFLERSLLIRWVAYQHTRGHGRRRLLLVGEPGVAMRSFLAAARAAPLAPEIVGRVGAGELAEGYSLPPPEQAADDLAAADLPPAMGSVRELERLLHEHPIDEVLFFPPLHEPRRARKALEICTVHGVVASFAVDLSRMHEAAPRVIEQLKHSFITFEVAPKSAVALALKHAMDAVVAAAAIVLLSPVMLVVALLILVKMGRPVLFAHERAGLRGRPFRMLKFRTMVRDAEDKKDALLDHNEMEGPTFKLQDDPRVTGLGRFLRRTSLDELPQLFNVLAGTMSLVGPRPLPVGEQRQIVGWHRRRLSMKPGITCLWQVSGRNEVDFERWMRLDLAYVDAWSLGLDFKILLRTIPAVLSGRGAR